MKKFSQLIIKIFLVTIIIYLIFMPALISEASFWGDIFQMGDNFVESGKNQGTTIDNEGMKNEMTRIYNILLALGIVLSVFIGAILGIKYMFGGIEEQAKIKETLFPYMVGCIIIFGAFGIWKLVMTVLSTV